MPAENNRSARDPCVSGYNPTIHNLHQDTKPASFQHMSATNPTVPNLHLDKVSGPTDKAAPTVQNLHQDKACAATAAAGGLPKRWEWPSWCLNFKSPSIEVFVVDDDTGVGRWVEAEPQSRVVDKSGRDAYLCVEYEWDGEYYVQDFGPQHVRRRGQLETVFALFDKAANQDTGGGVSSFLND